jgi:hypothetical protein
MKAEDPNVDTKLAKRFNKRRMTKNHGRSLVQVMKVCVNSNLKKLQEKLENLRLVDLKESNDKTCGRS